MSASRQFAIVTGASSGIGRELAKVCAREGFDLLIAADEPEIETAATEIRALGATVETVLADLSTLAGVDRLVDVANRIGRPVDALLANAGRGLGHGFLDQDFAQARHVIDTNITGTVYLVHRIGNDMRHRERGPHHDRRLDRRIRAGQFSGRLQRHQGISGLLLIRAARGIARQRGHGDLPDARRHRDQSSSNVPECWTPASASRERTAPRMSRGPASTP